MRKKIMCIILAAALLCLSACAYNEPEETAAANPGAAAEAAVESVIPEEPIQKPSAEPAEITENADEAPKPEEPPAEAETPAEEEPETPAPADAPQITEEDAFERYMAFRDAMSASADTDIEYDMDMFMDMNMEMELFGEKMSVPAVMEGNIKFIAKDGDIKYSSVMNSETLGETSVIEMQYDGDNWYAASDGEPMDISHEDLMEYMDSGFTVDAPDFGEDAIKSAETSIKDGNEVTAIIIDGGKLKDFTADSIPGAADMGLDNMSEMFENIDVSDIIITTVLKPDGTPVSMELNMVYGMGGIISIAIDCRFVFNKYGSGVEVDLSKLSTQIPSNL